MKNVCSYTCLTSAYLKRNSLFVAIDMYSILDASLCLQAFYLFNRFSCLRNFFHIQCCLLFPYLFIFCVFHHFSFSINQCVYLYILQLLPAYMLHQCRLLIPVICTFYFLFILSKHFSIYLPIFWPSSLLSVSLLVKFNRFHSFSYFFYYQRRRYMLSALTALT